MNKEKICNKCGQDMNIKWPTIASKLRRCPECCANTARKTTYTNRSAIKMLA